MPGKRTEKCLQYLEDLQASHPSLATTIQHFAGAPLYVSRVQCRLL